MKIIKYATPSCTICRAITPRIKAIVGKYKTDFEEIMIEPDNEYGITAVPTIKIEQNGVLYDVCSGGNPNTIIEMVEKKIKELR